MTDPEHKSVPIILDTDLGDDIDDSWAIAMLLKSPEVDVKLIVTDFGNTPMRARIVAKYLEAAGRTDIPIGIGVKQNDKDCPVSPWIEGYSLADYPGTVHEDGVGALIDAIMSSEETPTLLCIGPVPNIAEALRREPRIAEKARFVGMYGSVRKGYDGGPEISPEWNVRAAPAECRAVFEAAWDMTITPVDTCGIIRLRGENYARVRDCEDPLIRALIESYRVWAAGRNDKPEQQSSVLFDTVAAYLAFTEELLVVEELGIRISDDGYTLIDPEAKRVRCALEWTDLPAYERFLADRLVGER